MSKESRQWPFPGDSPVVRARKTALAYRETAKDLNGVINELCHVIRAVDPRIVGWMDDDGFQHLYKLIQEGKYPLSDPVEDLDQRIFSWGEEWHAEMEEHLQDDDWVDSGEAAKIISMARNTVNRLRLRGRIVGRWNKNPGNPGPGYWEYRVSDLRALSTEIRTRGSRAGETTDTVQTGGSTDAS